MRILFEEAYMYIYNKMERNRVEWNKEMDAKRAQKDYALRILKNVAYPPEFLKNAENCGAVSFCPAHATHSDERERAMNPESVNI